MKTKLGLGLLLMVLSSMASAAEKSHPCGEKLLDTTTSKGTMQFTICKNGSKLNVVGRDLEDGYLFWNDEYKLSSVTYTANYAEKIFRLRGSNDDSRPFEFSEANVEGETHYVIIFSPEYGKPGSGFFRAKKPTVNKLNQLF